MVAAEEEAVVAVHHAQERLLLRGLGRGRGHGRERRRGRGGGAWVRAWREEGRGTVSEILVHSCATGFFKRRNCLPLFGAAAGCEGPLPPLPLLRHTGGGVRTWVTHLQRDVEGGFNLILPHGALGCRPPSPPQVPVVLMGAGRRRGCWERGPQENEKRRRVDGSLAVYRPVRRARHPTLNGTREGT